MKKNRKFRNENFEKKNNVTIRVLQIINDKSILNHDYYNEKINREFKKFKVLIF